MFNKIDLEDKRIPTEELKSLLKLEVLQQERTVLVQECSALQNVGLWEGLGTIMQTVTDLAKTGTGPTASGSG